MSHIDLQTQSGRQAAFAAFRSNSFDQLMVKLRQQRAAQIQQLIADPATITLEQFNRELWQIRSEVTLREQSITDLSDDLEPDAARVAELAAAADVGELMIHGNNVWRSGSSVFGSGLRTDPSTKESYVRQALRILNDRTLAPEEKVRQIDQIPGFGRNTASGLVMLMHPTDWMIDNEQTRAALKQLECGDENEAQVQASAHQLRDELGAVDFLELDFFLWRMTHPKRSAASDPQIWWVYQGRSYSYEKNNNLIQAGLTSQNGRKVASWETVDNVRQADIIVHHVDQAIRAISLAQGGPSIVAETDGTPRRRVLTTYHELTKPVSFTSIAEPIRNLALVNGPIARNLRPSQGYLYSFSRDGLRIIYNASPDNNWPSYVRDLVRDDHSTSVSGETSVSDTAIPTSSFNALVTAMEGQGLYFPTELISNYLLALQAKGFVILTGISGTGKTQLALAIARYFQPVVQQTVPSTTRAGASLFTVKPYMHGQHRMVLPVALTAQMVLPPLDPSLTSSEINVHFPGGRTSLRLSRDVQRNVTTLLFREPFRSWFEKTLPEGSTFTVEALTADDGTASELRFNVPVTTRQMQRLDNVRLVAVKPDWTDPCGLLGYYNPITERYESTAFLRFLLDAHAEWEQAKRDGRSPHPYFLILDEMNLARVEYYFADFLSSVESGEPIELHDNPQLEVGVGAEAEQRSIPRQLCVPPNLLFTGTVNIDETTSMFSAKVLDRAFTVEFNQVDLAGFGTASNVAGNSILALEQLPSTILHPRKVNSADWTYFGTLAGGALRQTVIKLNEVLIPDQRHFGYRVANEIARFCTLAANQTDGSDACLWAALDLAVLAKVLPKLSGTQQELEPLLVRLFAFAVSHDSPTGLTTDTILSDWSEQNGLIKTIGDGASEPVLPRTAAKLWRMIRRLRQQGFVAFVS